MARILASRVRALLSSREKRKPAPTTHRRPETVTMLVADDRIDRRVLMQARSLVGAGVRTSVVALPHSGSTDADAAAFPEIEIIRIDPSQLSTFVKGEDQTRLGLLAGLGDAFFLHHRAFLLAALSRPADVVVAHDLPVLATAAMAADLTGARLFFDAHELYPEQAQLKAWRRQIYRIAERLLLPLADEVTTVNPSIAHELSHRGSVAAPTVILNAPYLPPEFDVTAERRRFHTVFDLPETTHVVLLHGSLAPNRNLAMLVEAMAQVDSDCVLVVMGPDGGCREQLEMIAERSGLLGNKVRFHEAVAQAQLLELVASADVGIVPYPAIDLNTRLCTPNKLFDFIACGVPVLANDLPELRRIIRDNGVGIVAEMSDPAALARAIDQILSSDLANMRRQSTKLSHKMCWQEQEPVLLALYGVTPNR